jgi:hypothetical protein
LNLYVTVESDGRKEYYSLRSANLHFKATTSTHVVAGLYCDDEYYVFDSNNVLVKYDWWDENHSVYIDASSKSYKKDPQFTYLFWYYAIYVRDNETQMDNSNL